MIVADLFEGDDLALARQQHDVYGEALNVIVEGCRRHHRTACAIVGIDADFWADDPRTDHRVLQDGHDILAAAWRWRARPPARDLFAPEAPVSMPIWLAWLEQEVDGWLTRPGLVQAVRVIVFNQNMPIGYRAEQDWCALLRDRFDDVRWTRPRVAR